MLRQRPTRESYLRSKLSVLIPSQIRSLRQRRGMKQSDLGVEADMKQARISALERIGEGSFSIETLIRLAAAFRVGLIIRFAPHSEMLDWESRFTPEDFDAISLDQDQRFLRAEQNHSNGTELSQGLREALSGENNRQFGRVSTALDENSLNDPPLIGGSMLDASETFNQAESQRGTAA